MNLKHILKTLANALVLIALFATLGGTLAQATPPVEGPSTGSGNQNPPEGLSADAWDRIQAQLESTAYGDSTKEVTGA